MSRSLQPTVEAWSTPFPEAHPVAVVVALPEKGPTVFVVDDDATIRKIVCSLMESAGLDVEAFSGPEAFLEAYDPDRPGCLLLDITMPGMTGVELQQQLAARKLAPAIIFLTGTGNVPMALQAIRTGAVDFLEKPFNARVLVARVHEALVFDRERRQAYAELQEMESRQAELTAREREVMDLMASGQTCKRIASRLEISPKTVDKHRAKILEKMQVDTSVALIQLLFGRRPR